MKKKVFFLVTAVISAMTATAGAGAFGGTYPQSAGFLAFEEASITGEKGAYTPTEEDHLFTVGGKTFILLDTDREGNYFVMTEEHYGQYPFQTAAARHMVIQEVRKQDDNYVFFRENKLSHDTWIFHPENRSSIAYWLNHDFYESGNGQGNLLPDEIKDHIMERDWQVEGFKTYYGSGTRLFDRYFDSLGVSGYIPSEVLASELAQKPYRVSGKLALPSLTEYLAYQKIIGVSFSFSNWGGMMLRSQDAFLTTGKEDQHHPLKCYFGPLQVFAPSADPSVKLKINIADAADQAYYYVRPVFWLSKDFFSEVKCDVESLGQYPKQFVTEQSYEDLTRVYSDAELAALGLVKPEGAVSGVCPKAEGVDFTGEAAAGKPLRGVYIYNKNGADDHAGFSEYLTRYQWYLSDTVHGEKYPAPEGDKLEFTPAEDQIGKFIWFAVTPKNAFNHRGETVYSKKIVKIRKNKNVAVSFSDSGGNSVTAIPQDGAMEIIIRYKLPEGRGVTAYIAGYDSDGRLTERKQSALRGEGAQTISVEIGKGTRCKVMVLGAPEEAPYCIAEIRR